MDINEKIYLNVKALAKLNEKGMKEVETAIGKSPGYLSRKKTISVEMLLELARMFGVTATMLMENDYVLLLKRKEAGKVLEQAAKEALRFLTTEKYTEIVNKVLEDWKEGN